MGEQKEDITGTLKYCRETSYKLSMIAANVSYYYNYERGDDKYYWIDLADYGEKITFIPEDPVREGYTFGGWYKEAECINQWDFDEDTLPETEYVEVESNSRFTVRIFKDHMFPKYKETILYAKWIEQVG